MTHPLDNALGTRLPEPRQWLGRVMWIVLLAGLALRPIAADDFWWHIARGRTVCQGTTSPSATLLGLETACEADWFGGVPLFVLFDVTGFHGLMMFRVVAVVAMALALMRLGGAGKSRWELVTLSIGLAASSAACGATPRLFDLFGLLLVAAYCPQIGTNRDRLLSLLAPLVVLALWANLATLPIVGWTLFAAVRLDAALVRRDGVRVAAKRLALELFLAAGACSLTPRGVFTLRDSLRLAVPRLAVDSAVLQETTWRPLASSDWGLGESAFVLLTVIAFWNLLKRPLSMVVCVQVFVASTLGWMNAAAVPIAALWLTVALMQTWRAGGISPPVIPVADENRGANAPRSPDTIDEPQPQRRWRRQIPTTALAGLAVVVWLPWPDQRPGWGLDPRLDHRILDATLREVTLDGTAWTDDVRSAGMCAWVTRGRIKSHDVPQRALLGGRLRDFVLLRHDLEWNRLSRYRREDDSWGGWWLPLRERHTGLVLVAAEHTRLIRSLEPTIWKPLALDSPVLPYGQAGDRGVSERIVAILKQRAFAEDGPWVSQLLSPSGTDLSLDLWGFCGGVSPNLEQELRQSRVFRAMHLPRAGLRVLLPALRVCQADALRHEFAMCNRDLSVQLHREAGWGSAWHNLLSVGNDPEVLQEFRGSHFSVSVITQHAVDLLYLVGLLPLPWQQQMSTSSSVITVPMERPDPVPLSDLLFDDSSSRFHWPAQFGDAAIAAFRGDEVAAASALAPDNGEFQMTFARACLAWDTGRLDVAAKEFRKLLELTSPDEKLFTNWVRHVLESLSSTESP